jgi:hypothetical protein
MPNELQERTYKSLMQVYDDTEKVIQSAELYGKNFEPYVKYMQKLIETVEKNTEIMVDNFFKSVETGRELTNSQKLKIENSVKDINIAAKQFLLKISN